MVLEACVIILDNSEWTRNGDYSPSRLEASKEAANYLATCKLNSNVENAVSVMTMGGSTPKVLLSLTSDRGKVATSVGLVQNEGDSASLEAALQVAQIVLKHRQNTNQRQRIVAFVASPLSAEGEENLVTLARKLKKNSVAVDFIDFGTENRTNTVILQQVLEAINTDNNSRLVTVVPGGSGQVLVDVLVMEAPEMFERAGGAGEEMGGVGGEGFEFGVDPSMDPELALALKMSMEEEMARQQREQQQQGGNNAEENADVEMAGTEVEEEDEETMLAKAIAMSMETAKQETGSNADPQSKI